MKAENRLEDGILDSFRCFVHTSCGCVSVNDKDDTDTLAFQALNVRAPRIVDRCFTVSREILPLVSIADDDYRWPICTLIIPYLSVLGFPQGSSWVFSSLPSLSIRLIPQRQRCIHPHYHPVSPHLTTSLSTFTPSIHTLPNPFLQCWRDAHSGDFFLLHPVLGLHTTPFFNILGSWSSPYLIWSVYIHCGLSTALFLHEEERDEDNSSHSEEEGE
ncbi:hypothetical protein ADUPG1_000434 [Aduncisulcus paluster]|uniref:Uncharacterized protein n=1 Tax=Aduncisulcus paluster TaxID=2918883 RepID=A0ABQ5K6C2_9EUKA|nr:hypothetical protein ADUPG1_000434 [Aduncisulcus paluster]